MSKRILDIENLKQAQSALNSAQRTADKELDKARKRITSKKGPLTPMEYAILHENSVPAAEQAAQVIEAFLKALSSSEEALVLLAWSNQHPQTEKTEYRFLLASLLEDTFHLKQEWEAQSQGVCYWTSYEHDPNSGNCLCVDYSLKGPHEFPPLGTQRCDIPLHRLMLDGQLVVGEEAVWKRFMQDRQRSADDERTAFECLASKYQAMDYVPKLDAYREHFEFGREETLRTATRLVTEYKYLFKKLLITGPTREFISHKNDNSYTQYFSYARTLRENLASLLKRAKLYGVENDSLLKLKALYYEWLPHFTEL